MEITSGIVTPTLPPSPQVSLLGTHGLAITLHSTPLLAELASSSFAAQLHTFGLLPTSPRKSLPQQLQRPSTVEAAGVQTSFPLNSPPDHSFALQLPPSHSPLSSCASTNYFSSILGFRPKSLFTSNLCTLPAIDIFQTSLASSSFFAATGYLAPIGTFSPSLCSTLITALLRSVRTGASPNLT